MMEREHPGKGNLDDRWRHSRPLRLGLRRIFPQIPCLREKTGSPTTARRQKKLLVQQFMRLTTFPYGSTAGIWNSLRLPCPGVRRELLGAGFIVLRTIRAGRISKLSGRGRQGGARQIERNAL